MPDPTIMAVLYGNWSSLDPANFPEWNGRISEVLKVYFELGRRLRKEVSDGSGAS